MPRIRTLKPEAWSHRKVGRLSIPARQLWTVMITQADDDGREIADPGQLRVLAFPYDREITDEQVAGWRDEIAAPGLIQLYEVDGVLYAHFPSWRDHQRIHRNHYTPSKLPPPPHELSGTSTGPVPDMSGTSTGEVPPEGKGRDRRTTTAPGAVAPGRSKAADAPGFTEWFWPLYPKHVARARALRAWNRLKPSEAVQAEMRVALERQVKSEGWTKDNGQYVPHPASWLNGQRWTDEVEAGGGGGDDEVQRRLRILHSVGRLRPDCRYDAYEINREWDKREQEKRP